ncbi:GNAT family N-acetyltransferase [Nonomuraea jabiensis]|uniref:GNAT family N-acetyltransferase n=1 Tax=Nonomuraea jabiensis TaxID=882448 RepID=UPI003D70298B
MTKPLETTALRKTSGTDTAEPTGCGWPCGTAGWWSRSGTRPEVLETLDIDDTCDDPLRIDIGERLLRTALAELFPAGTRPPQYVLQPVPADWRDDSETGRRIRDRIEVVRRTGGKVFVERLRYRWTADTPLPAPRGRLAFRPVRDDEEAIVLLTGILSGTLDAHSQAGVDRSSIEDYARVQYHDELLSYPSPREWWRVGVRRDGEPVGMDVPAQSPNGFVIAYLGVTHGHRGQGFVNDLLGEGTRLLAAQGADWPMAQAFERAGYDNFARRIDMCWDERAPGTS